MTEDMSHDGHIIRLPVAEAAEWLGVSASAVRKRVERGTLQADKDGDGRVYVYLDTVTETRRETVRDTSHDTPYAAALVEQLRDENRFLRAELERKDAILLSLSEGLRAINPPPEPPEARQTPGEGSEWPESAEGVQYGTSPQQAQESLHNQRPWWRRIWGG